MKDGAGQGAEARVEAAISRLLYSGVVASMGLVALGTVLCFLHSGDYGVRGGTPADLHRLLAGGAAFPRTLAWLVGGLGRVDGTALIVLGLLLLIATPVLRVAVSIVAFAAGRDRAYVIITSIVLTLLVLSFVLGKAG